jgi:putative nucleotidyltransferase with HDIG domain
MLKDVRRRGPSGVKSPGCHADDRRVVSRRPGLILAAQAALPAAAVAAAALSSETAHWQPVELVLLLFVLAAGSEVLTIQFRGVRISASFLAIVLAMALLGPAPAGAIGAGSMLVDGLITRAPYRHVVTNMGIFTIFPVVGGLLIASVAPELTPYNNEALGFAGAVLLVFMLTNALNFGLVVLAHRPMGGGSIVDMVRHAFLPVLPAEFATGLLTAGVAFIYGRVGVGAVGLLAVVIFVFQYLFRAGVQAFERGEELGQRTRELASLQVGLLTTVMQTLSMRDPMTARHSAAVARYAREVAEMLELPPRERELVHTAALLHDIGKFIFPDSILFADRKLTDEEWETVKLHPEQGARLVARIEGYGPVAEIIHSHHERIDGRGYPAGLSGDDIPLGSRIISVADTYDVMTSRDSYRRPVSSEAAIAELRRVAGSQLDPIIVEMFIEIVEAGRVAFHHADEADFELELAFERRVEDYARPRALVA